MMRAFNKIKLLQAFDSLVFICLLAAIAIIVWLGITGAADKTQHNLHGSMQSLEEANGIFQEQVSLEMLIDQQRELFDKMHDELFDFVTHPDDASEHIANLELYSSQLAQKSQQFFAAWPTNASEALKQEYQTSIASAAQLTAKLKSANPTELMSFASEVRANVHTARDLMESIEDLDNQMGEDISYKIHQSIDTTNSSTKEMVAQLNQIKYRLLWSMAFIVVLLILSRLYFSARFKSITLKAQIAQATAEEAVKTKARFLATMSHEIRTPMNGVIGMTRLLMNTPMSKKQTEFVESINLSGEHLLTVINDVLDFSKLEAGKLDLKRDALDLRACIEDVLNLLTSKALEKNLELAYAVGPSVPLYIEGDMVRLRQVLTNLLGNAIKFTDQGEVTVFVLPRSQIGDVFELEFQINDTGPGIPHDRLDSIFEQFSRADDNVTHRHEGTGLGLAISRRLVEMMEGRIWAESTLGIGSRFHFTIKTRKTEGNLKPFLHTNIPEVVGKRILIVENNPANHQAIQNYCVAWGAKTEALCSSSEAIAALASGKHFELGLIESNLPNSSALDLARYIRSRYNKQELPLILIAPPNDTHPKEVVRELFNLYLTKPITRSRLFDSLMTVMGELNLVIQQPKKSNIKLGERLPLSILLVEDNAINQIVASSILDEMAYKVDLAENGLEAIQAITKKFYNVVFMDMQMPEMDGLEATRRIRAQFPADKQPIIIAMTANAMDGDKQECLDAGMNDYISKPILPEVIEKTLQRWCEEYEPIS